MLVMPVTSFFMLYTSYLDFQVHQAKDAETVTISTLLKTRKNLCTKPPSRLKLKFLHQISFHSSVQLLGKSEDR